MNRDAQLIADIARELYRFEKWQVIIEKSSGRVYIAPTESVKKGNTEVLTFSSVKDCLYRLQAINSGIESTITLDELLKLAAIVYSTGDKKWLIVAHPDKVYLKCGSINLKYSSISEGCRKLSWYAWFKEITK